MERGGQPQASESVVDIARDTRRKAQFLLKKPFVEQQEIYQLAKSFFKAYLRKPVEFTSHELRKELHKVYLSTAVRERIDAMVEKLGLIEYTDTQYGQEEVKLLIEELDSIVRELVVEHKKQLPWLTRFANWLFRKKERKTETVISEYPVVEENDRATVEINTLLEGVYVALERNKAKQAAKLYREAMRKYDSLGPSAQIPFYHELQAAYEAIVKQEK